MKETSKYSARVIIPGTQRADGSLRKDIVVKADYISPDMIPKYVHPNAKKTVADESDDKNKSALYLLGHGSRPAGAFALPQINNFLAHYVPPNNQSQERKKMEKLDYSISLTTEKPSHNQQKQPSKVETLISAMQNVQVREKEKEDNEKYEKELTPTNREPQKDDNKETAQSLIEKRDAEMKKLTPTNREPQKEAKETALPLIEKRDAEMKKLTPTNREPQKKPKETAQSLIEKRNAEMKKLENLISTGVLEEEEIIQKWNEFVDRWNWLANSV